jgi:hypothetical protein
MWKEHGLRSAKLAGYQGRAGDGVPQRAYHLWKWCLLALALLWLLMGIRASLVF